MIRALSYVKLPHRHSAIHNEENYETLQSEQQVYLSISDK